MFLTAGQIRAARAFIGWSARKLAERAKLGLSTVQRVEAGESITSANLDAIYRTLDKAGVEFIPENGGGAGVRLKKDSDLPP
jgi:transcriptional regulator with XRE-family HTH domain